MIARIVCSLSAISLAAIASRAGAQGSSFTGRVLVDSVQTPLAGAEVSLPALAKVQRTDERGEFRVTGIPAGEHVVQIRMPGYAPEVDTIEVADAGEVRRDYRLERIEATLPEVPVKASLLDRKLSEFYERRRMGIGRFLDSAEFAKAPGTRTSDRLKKLPGLMIGRGRFLSEAYVLSTRDQGKRPGSSQPCRAAIWLDGVNLWTNYSVNELDPSMIAAIEWYAGPASVPAKFNITPSTPDKKYCGVLLIWLR